MMRMLVSREMCESDCWGTVSKDFKNPGMIGGKSENTTGKLELHEWAGVWITDVINSCRSIYVCLWNRGKHDTMSRVTEIKVFDKVFLHFYMLII